MSHIEKLIERMTLEEKLGQLTMTASGSAVTGPLIAADSTDGIRRGTIGNLLNLVGADQVLGMQRLAVEESRLGIPLLIGLDVLHGHRILFPIPLGEAAIFEHSAWEASARESATEAAADGLAMTFAPMLDVSRDPRWGRSAEGPGEDAWLGACIARAKIRGFQGVDLSRGDSLAAVAKHFCGYGAVSAGREYASADISERSLREVHMPAFAAAVAAGVAAIMPAFIDMAGIPMTANKRLLQGWLREKWGFDGVIVSDYNAIAELVHHGIATDLADAATLALKAGVDIDMMADAYRRGLPVAVERGHVSLRDIDAAVRRVLTLKEKLGLFDDPYRRGSATESTAALAQRRRLARTLGAKAIVMLKNAQSTLPLFVNKLRLAVLGPLADSEADMRGPWWGAAGETGHVTVLAGLRAALPGAHVDHSPGVAIDTEEVAAIGIALDLCNGVDVVVLCVGEAASMSGEASSRAHLGLPGRQRALCNAVFDRAVILGIPVIVILFSGRPLVVPWLIERADAVLAAWFLGSEAGHAIADVLTGRVSPSGRTPVSWPRAEGQVPIFFGQRPSGRPADRKDRFTSKYLDVPNDPLFPFGFGLTYGRFEYSNLRVSALTLQEHQSLTVSVDVANRGDHAATETVFLFTRDTLADVSRPLLELRGFDKITLQPGAMGTVVFSVRGSDLYFLDTDLTCVFEAGELEFLAGPCADRAQLLDTKITLR